MFGKTAFGPALALTALLAVAASPASAQLLDDWTPSNGYTLRPELEKLFNRLENVANSPAYAPAQREEARMQSAAVYARLQNGDFHVGDRIVLEVKNEPLLSDTFAVDQGRVLDLPGIGRMPLHGVLRSELEPKLHQFMGRFLRRPELRARSLIRVTVLGAVRAPGFYTVRSEALLSDVVMRAGGPTPRARLEEVRIERGNGRVWEGQYLQQAMSQGRTLDEMNLLAGDRIFVPERGDGVRGVERGLRTVTLLLSIPLSIFAVTQIF